MLVTPSEALQKLIGFIDRIERLEANEYTIPRLRSADLNKLKWEIHRITLFASIAVHNKNKKRSKEIVDRWRKCFIKGIEIREQLYEQEGREK